MAAKIIGLGLKPDRKTRPAAGMVVGRGLGCAEVFASPEDIAKKPIEQLRSDLRRELDEIWKALGTAERKTFV